MKPRFEACMILAAVGDAIGYKRGHWEFNYNGKEIHQEMLKMTEQKGVLHLRVDKRMFPYSDDTVMHIATAKALLAVQKEDPLEDIAKSLAKEYKQCWKFMKGRAPGGMCQKSVRKLYEDGSNWDCVEFDENGGGCGGSMRSACIGLLYWNNIKKLVEVSMQSGRITHHHPVGYLGSVVAAYFTSQAIRGVDPRDWLHLFFKQALPYARDYAQKSRQPNQNLDSWKDFEKYWKRYSATRQISLENVAEPKFSNQYGTNVQEREKDFKMIAGSPASWPGATGADSVIIAYDCLLYSKDNWEKLCLTSMLHGGDSDSTGTIAAAWFGALYGFKDIPTQHTDGIEGRQELLSLATKLYQRSGL